MNPLFGANTGINPYVPSSAFNYSNPYNRTAYMQTQPMQQIPVSQSIVPQSNIIWVNSEEEIANYPTGRGWQQLFGDKNKNMFYIRETDLNGITQPIKRITYAMDEPKVEAEAPPQTDHSVTREEFDKLTNAVNGMAEKLAELLK